MFKTQHTIGLIIIILIRIIAPLVISINPFIGLIIANTFDFIDVILLSLFKIKITHNTYTLIDKLLDTWINIILLINIPLLITSNFQLQLLAYILFTWRTLGVILAINLNNNKIFVLTPNFFYYFMGIFCFIKTFNVQIDIQNHYLPIAIIITFLFNLSQEIILHALNIKPWKALLELIQRP